MKRLFAALLAVILLAGCSDSVEEEHALARGAWEGNTFTSEFANLRFEMPEGWNYASEEEMANIFGVGQDMMSEAGIGGSRTYTEMMSVYDMMAADPITRTSIMLVYENLNFVVGGNKITTADYTEILKANFTKMDLGYTFPKEAYEGQLGGESYTVLEAHLPGAIQYYYFRKRENFMQCFTITLFGTDTLEDLLACFSALD